jgi:hypothetical protein
LYKDYFEQMRRALAEPDGEFIPFVVLRTCVENRVPLPRWAARALLEIGDRLIRTPTRPGHNSTAYDRDVQRSIDAFRAAVVSKFRKTENLSLDRARERAVEYLNQFMQDGRVAGKRIAGETSAIRDSCLRVARLRKKPNLPRLRRD